MTYSILGIAFDVYRQHTSAHGDTGDMTNTPRPYSSLPERGTARHARHFLRTQPGLAGTRACTLCVLHYADDALAKRCLLIMGIPQNLLGSQATLTLELFHLY